MHREALVCEAKKCRECAPEYAGRPERPFLLKLAKAFDELAGQKSEPSRRPE